MLACLARLPMRARRLGRARVASLRPPNGTTPPPCKKIDISPCMHPHPLPCPPPHTRAPPLPAFTQRRRGLCIARPAGALLTHIEPQRATLSRLRVRQPQTLICAFPIGCAPAGRARPRIGGARRPQPHVLGRAPLPWGAGRRRCSRVGGRPPSALRHGTSCTLTLPANYSLSRACFARFLLPSPPDPNPQGPGAHGRALPGPHACRARSPGRAAGNPLPSPSSHFVGRS